MGPISKLATGFVAVKLVQVALLAAVPAQFDISSQLLLHNYLSEKIHLLTFHTPIPQLNAWLGAATRFALDNVVDKLVTWDTVYFTDLFAHDIHFEHQYVFCPLWWRLVRSIPVPIACNFYGRVLVATAIANTCHFLGAVVLFHYTLLVFENARIFSPKHMALASLALYVLTPAALFVTAPYSEPGAALFSFGCLFLREKALPAGFGSRPVNSRLYVASGVAAALAFGFRANCLLLGFVYLYDLALQPRRIPPVLPLVAGLILGLAFLWLQVTNYLAVCITGDRGEWCLSRFPSLFAYAQSHYWNNGFLRYWTAGNVPNFAFAAPTIAFSLYGIRYFRQIFPVDRVMPVLVVNLVFIVLLLGFWHVQIVTRTATFLPIVYWVGAGMVTQPDQTHRWAGNLWLGYSVVWLVVQTCLFGAFLPPA